MTETQRRKVTVIMMPHGKKLSIIQRDGLFVLLDENEAECATCHSNNALSLWAFNFAGAFSIRHGYNLAEGDDGR